MFLVLTLSLIIVMVLYTINTKSSIFQPLQAVAKYQTVPKTYPNRVHLVIPYEPLFNAGLIDKVLLWILNQTERVDAVSITVPHFFEQKQIGLQKVVCEQLPLNHNITSLTKDTCMVQLVGGLSMLIKEPERGTTILFLNHSINPNVLNDDKAIHRALWMNDRSIFSSLNTSIDVPLWSIYGSLSFQTL